MSKSLVRSALLMSFVPAALALSAGAQGSDNCSTATLIVGQGNFAFDNSTATTGSQGQSEASCNFFSTTGITNDVWFKWMAPASGTAGVSLCSGSSMDSKIAAYAGAGCPGAAALACNDDSCGLQSQILFPVLGGNFYTIQIGNYPSSAGSSGTFSITIGGGQTGCGGGPGPDVIVGDIPNVLNAPPLGGIDALALGTTSCNIGSQNVNWIGGTNDHPVIRQNLYRYKIVNGAGRFEQVGMSWLKHGFASLQDSLCCACSGSGDGSHLGVGCSDPYDAGLNGSQGGLGPNWQVNAHTGFFPYPPANPSHGTDSIYRRCQVAVSDLEVTGGANTTRYFGEAQYVTKDDAAAGNQNNNASWREVSTSGGPGDYNFGLIGVTERARSAIRAWGEIDPAVNLVDLQIADDGLVILGTRATDLGAGMWRYEYAVYNMNADRNVGSIALPIPASVTVSNIGFHGVNYHDGDGNGSVNASSTPWTSSNNSGVLSWACEVQAQNNNANAIRWGTLYNFRFDANAAPQLGPITLGIWKAGATPSIAGVGHIPSGATTGSGFCFGDGSVVSCPCGNNGLSGRGCNNSTATGGGLISATGSASLALDTVHFTTTGELPAALSIVLQGDAIIAPINFGDGLRCAGGNLLRLFVQNANGGSVIAPGRSDPSVSARAVALGQPIPAGGTRIYQVYYRDPATAFCPFPTGDNFNATNAVSITWGF